MWVTKAIALQVTDSWTSAPSQGSVPDIEAASHLLGLQYGERRCLKLSETLEESTLANTGILYTCFLFSISP
ncbi:hypothetical protein VULLAG_LOCUS14672 [Vulpes lagopus]